MQQYKASIFIYFADDRVWCASSHFLRRQKEAWCMMWVSPPTVVIFGLWDPTIIGRLPDTKKLLLFAATRFQFMESIRGASSADRSSMLQKNETIYGRTHKKNRFFSKTAPINGGQLPRNKYLIWDSQPDFLTSLLFAPRSPFWTASSPSKLLFFKTVYSWFHEYLVYTINSIQATFVFRDYREI